MCERGCVSVGVWRGGGYECRCVSVDVSAGGEGVGVSAGGESLDVSVCGVELSVACRVVK